jgi:hypothetical protein
MIMTISPVKTIAARTALAAIAMTTAPCSVFLKARVRSRREHERRMGAGLV